MSWKPSFMRGTIEKINERTFFVDCYNANPKSFEDSLKHFDKLFPEDNRLFIVGCFSSKELGCFCKEENFKLGLELPLRSKDQAIIIGEDAYSVAKGIEEQQHGNFHCVKDIAQAIPYVKKHKGAVYLKGHHVYELEKLVM